jgi:3-oxoacyl-[acyl-carrier protein] reductase
VNLGLEGRVAAVAGAGAGIGRASALALAGEGAHVALGARRPDQLERACADVAACGVRVAGACADLATEHGFSSLIDAAVGGLGGLDALVMSIGATPLGGVEELDDERWEAAFRQKFLAALRGVRLAVPHMRRRGGGSIVIVAGGGSRVGAAHMATSAVINGALERIVGELARRHAHEGIAVNCLSPGPVRTARYEVLVSALAGFEGGGRADAERRLLAAIPAGRAARAHEIGAIAAFLASPLARHITGTTVLADGGRSGAAGS